MTKKRLLAAAAALSLAALDARAQVGAAEAPQGPASLAIVGVDVVPMDEERVLEAHTVVVEDGIIVRLGPSAEVEVPAGARRIDADGKFLLPGLAEMHGHLPAPNDASMRAEDVLFLYVANGVTLVRGMQGHPSQLDLRRRVETGEVLGPRLVVGSPAIGGDAIESPAAAERLVRDYRAAGYDLLKVHEGLPAEIYAAIAATANGIGMPFGGHVSDDVGLLEALDAGQATIDHLDNYVEALVPAELAPATPAGLFGTHLLVDLVDESLLPSVVAATIEAGAAVVPTMVLWESGIFPTRASSELLEERDELRYMPPEAAEAFAASVDERRAAPEADKMLRLAELRRRILVALHEGGARILLGTDSPQIFSVPGFSIHREMQLYQDAGMTPYEVLAAGTRRVGEHYGEAFGTVAVGSRADLILVDANPLEDVANAARPAGLVVGGRFVSADEIRTGLERIAASPAR